MKEIFGKEISRDLIGRLAGRDLIGTGPREPRRGAPYTFVTTETFLAAFGLMSLCDLPDSEQMAAHEQLARPTPKKLALRPAGQATLVINVLTPVRAIVRLRPALRATPRQFPANRARRTTQKQGDLPLAAAPLILGKDHCPLRAI